jgi:uncharacterized protein (DUF2141 family)
MITQITGKDASFEFSDIKPGKYAIAVIHDENCNGKLDTNMFGIPKEGYGFSSGAEVTMSAPSFSDAVFSYDGGHFKFQYLLNFKIQLVFIRKKVLLNLNMLNTL